MFACSRTRTIPDLVIGAAGSARRNIITGRAAVIAAFSNILCLLETEIKKKPRGRGSRILSHHGGSPGVLAEPGSAPPLSRNNQRRRQFKRFVNFVRIVRFVSFNSRRKVMFAIDLSLHAVC